MTWLPVTKAPVKGGSSDSWNSLGGFEKAEVSAGSGSCFGSYIFHLKVVMGDLGGLFQLNNSGILWFKGCLI